MGVCGEEIKKSKIKIEEKDEPIDEGKINLVNQVKNEVFTGHKPISVKIVNKVMKSICKITIKSERGNITFIFVI